MGDRYLRKLLVVGAGCYFTARGITTPCAAGPINWSQESPAPRGSNSSL